MAGHAIDTFFTVTNAEGTRIGHAVQGARVARWNWTDGRMYDVDAVPLAQRWPQLPEAFRLGFDAALTTPADNPWTWVFRGSQCLRLHPVDGTIGELTTIAARFPGLPTVFTQGIDAALPGPGANEVYLFSGDQCARYDLRVPAVVEAKSIAETWSGLTAKAPEFAHGLGAATYDPESGHCYLFRGGQYARGALATATIDQAAAPVTGSAWPGLLPAFTRGHLITASDIRAAYALDLESGESAPMGNEGSPTTTPDGRYLHLLRGGAYPRWTCIDMAEGRQLWAGAGDMTGRRVTFSRDGLLAYFLPWNQHSDSYGNLTIADPLTPGTVAMIHLFDHDQTGAGSGGVIGADVPEVQPPQSQDEGPADKSGMPGSRWPVAPPVALTPAGDMAYVGFHTGQAYRMLEVDLVERRVRQTFHVPDAGAPLDILIDADARTAHVAQERGTCAIDLHTGAVVRQGVLPPCRALMFTPDRGELWCLPAADHGGVLVADPATHTVLRRIPIGGHGGLGTGVSLEFNHFGTYAYVLLDGGTELTVIDVAARRAVSVHRTGVSRPGDYRIAYTTY
ncbi:hypothetical protein [Streptomyces sp. URMC 123]|uniref:hypothetical protein n=1 Tax=Streptomyces sp. URMC 123 TaxID=3423403 RepID=UPI003F1DB075